MAVSLATEPRQNEKRRPEGRRFVASVRSAVLLDGFLRGSFCVRAGLLGLGLVNVGLDLVDGLCRLAAGRGLHVLDALLGGLGGGLAGFFHGGSDLCVGAGCGKDDGKGDE